MNITVFRKVCSLILAAVMLLGMMPVTGLSVRGTSLSQVSEGEDTESPADAVYDFTIPGSTIHFLDMNGDLLTEEAAWTEGENVVENWHIFMYRQTKDDLKLGYSTDGALFLPHSVYEGDSADLLYVTDNNLFRVTANQDGEQTFDGSQILKTVTLQATGESVTLANAPVYAETPFTFVHIGNTDENGTLSVNATLGEFTLWVTSNQGFLVSKMVTVTESTTQISFADEIANAVQVDAAGKYDADPNGPGYVLAIGKPGETDPTNMLTTSYLLPQQSVWVTPGTYSVACAIYVRDQYDEYEEEYRALWVELADSAQIREATTYDFTLAGFEGKLELGNDGALVYPGDEIPFSLYAQDANGYSIPGDAGSYWSTKNRVVVTVGEVQYPYTFEVDPFSTDYTYYVYSKNDEQNPVHEDTSYESKIVLPFQLFGNTQKEYLVKYRSGYDSRVFPDLFPEDVYYSASLQTRAATEVTYRLLKTEQNYDYVYYFDENGEQQTARCDYGTDGYYYLLPSCVKNGDTILVGTTDWGTETMDHNVVTVTDALFESAYTFQPHTDFTNASFTVKNGEEDENYYSVSYTIGIDGSDGTFQVEQYSNSPLAFPRGEYVFAVAATCETWDEETYLLSCVDYISHVKSYTLSEETYEFTIDYADYKTIKMDASSFFPQDSWLGDYYKKLFTLYFADGTVREIPWHTVPLNVYTETAPQYISGEMYYYDTQEMYPFSPYISYEKFPVEEGRTYSFDFTPKAIDYTGTAAFDSNQSVVLTYAITDGFGNVMNDAKNLLNQFAVHDPLRSKEYPFRNASGEPVDQQYTIDVYYRLQGTSEYQKRTFSDFAEADLGELQAGEYEGYITLDLDVYRDEYLVEYPIEKDPNRSEYGFDFTGVYDNIDKILHGTLRDEIAFTVTAQTHTHSWSAWSADQDAQTHTRYCTAEGCTILKETGPHRWDTGAETKAPTCTEDGELTYTCLDCKATGKEAITSPGHSWDDWYSLDQETHKRECTADGCEAFETQDHQWSNWAEKDEASHIRTCVCKAEETAPHSFGDWKNFDNAPGNHYRECGDCWAYEMEPHSWSAWTEISEGVYQRSCDVCKETETMTIDKEDPVNTTTGNAADTDLADPDMELIDKILTDVEQSQVAAGADVKIYLKVEDISNDTPTEHQAAAEAEAGDDEIGMYLDIELFKQVGTGEQTQVTETTGTVTITITIPEELINTDTTITRTYKIIRVHEDENGGLVTDVIEGVFDPEDNTFTFETDKFSTYALAYADTEKMYVAVEIGGVRTEFLTLAAAMEQADDGSTLQLLADITENITVTKLLTLDLNGFDLTGSITGALTVKDSQTDDFTVEDSFGYGQIIGTAADIQAAEGYVKITESGIVSFHAVGLKLTAMTLRAERAGVYYKSNFSADEVVARNVASYGIALSIRSEPNAGNLKNCVLSNVMLDFVSGGMDADATSTLLKNVMKTTNSDQLNSKYASMAIYGRAYIRTTDGQYVFGQCVDRTFRKQVELIDEKWNDLLDEQREAVLDMYALYKNIMDAWTIPNIQNAAQ